MRKERNMKLLYKSNYSYCGGQMNVRRETDKIKSTARIRAVLHQTVL